jgi:hypothetical protein
MNKLKKSLVVVNLLILAGVMAVLLPPRNIATEPKKGRH